MSGIFVCPQTIKGMGEDVGEDDELLAVVALDAFSRQADGMRDLVQGREHDVDGQRVQGHQTRDHDHHFHLPRNLPVGQCFGRRCLCFSIGHRVRLSSQ